MEFFVQIHAAEGTTLQQSFEGLAEAIGSLPGMYFEPDGSFVWVDHSLAPSKQMDGMVYDKHGRLMYVELKGDFSSWQWLTLCNAICQIQVETEVDASFDQWNNQIRVHDLNLGVWSTAPKVLRRCS